MANGWANLPYPGRVHKVSVKILAFTVIFGVYLKCFSGRK